jgi:hypothetical protein
MANEFTDDELNEILIGVCDHWNDRKEDLSVWETTEDARVQFHLVIQYWGEHHRYLVFQDKINQPYAKTLLDPIFKTLAENKKAGTCKAVPNAVDYTILKHVLDAERTKKANKKAK